MKIFVLLLLGLQMIMSAQTTELYKEVYRPQFHYSAPQWWLNDPNGLVYYEGEYHLFYQYHPYDVVWGPMHWGHAVSTDLVHWETLPIALYPDDLGTIFSGTVVVDANNTSGLVPGGGLVALYTYHTQTQGAAYSTDKGRTWTKYDGNPIIDALAKDFRDPKVFWHEATERWVMALSAGQSVMFLTSENLLQWEVASTFAGGYESGVWEVPDLFTLPIEGEEKWVLIVSVNPTAPAGGSGTRYYIGEFDGKTFTDDYPDETLWFDYGPDNYAGTTWNNLDRRLFIAWMNNWDYANIIPTSTWRGAMTFPRELSLRRTDDGIRIVQTPVETLADLREPIGQWTDLMVEGEQMLDGVQGQQLEIIAEIEPGTAKSFGFDVLQNEDDSFRIVYNVEKEQLIIRRPQSGIRSFNPIFTSPLKMDGDTLKLHILIDHSSVEIFANEGLLAVTTQVFPEPGSTGVTLFSQSGLAAVRSLEVNALRSIWDKKLQQ